jgi:hypothetical protein
MRAANGANHFLEIASSAPRREAAKRYGRRVDRIGLRHRGACCPGIVSRVDEQFELLEIFLGDSGIQCDVDDVCLSVDPILGEIGATAEHRFRRAVAATQATQDYELVVHDAMCDTLDLYYFGFW